jgi:hypothetical protein
VPLPRLGWQDNIQTNLREMGWGGMDSIDLDQDRDPWRTLVDTVINLRVPQNVGNLRIADQLAVSQEGLSSMQLVILECWQSFHKGINKT